MKMYMLMFKRISLNSVNFINKDANNGQEILKSLRLVSTPLTDHYSIYHLHEVSLTPVAADQIEKALNLGLDMNHVLYYASVEFELKSKEKISIYSILEDNGNFFKLEKPMELSWPEDLLHYLEYLEINPEIEGIIKEAKDYQTYLKSAEYKEEVRRREAAKTKALCDKEVTEANKKLAEGKSLLKQKEYEKAFVIFSSFEPGKPGFTRGSKQLAETAMRIADSDLDKKWDYLQNAYNRLNFLGTINQEFLKNPNVDNKKIAKEKKDIVELKNKLLLCPFPKLTKNYPGLIDLSYKDAFNILDIINRQQTEIEALQEKVKNLTNQASNESIDSTISKPGFFS